MHETSLISATEDGSSLGRPSPRAIQDSSDSDYLNRSRKWDDGDASQTSHSSFAIGRVEDEQGTRLAENKWWKRYGPSVYCTCPFGGATPRDMVGRPGGRWR